MPLLAIIVIIVVIIAISLLFETLGRTRISNFFLDDKTSAPDVFSSCSFIPRAHFETSLVMVSYYGYEI